MKGKRKLTGAEATVKNVYMFTCIEWFKTKQNKIAWYATR